AGEVVELGLEPVIRLLGEPGDSVVTGLGHKHSSIPPHGDPLRRAPAGPQQLGVIHRDYFVSASHSTIYCSVHYFEHLVDQEPPPKVKLSLRIRPESVADAGFGPLTDR